MITAAFLPLLLAATPVDRDGPASPSHPLDPDFAGIATLPERKS
jgi:hypothetical protein